MTLPRLTSPASPAFEMLAGIAMAALAVALSAAPAAPRPEGSVGGPAQAAPSRRPPAPPATTNIVPQPETGAPEITPKQQRAILKARYEKMKEQAGELARLAEALQADLNKSSENVLSLQVVEKADKIEKLAKQIKSAAVQ